MQKWYFRSKLNEYHPELMPRSSTSLSIYLSFFKMVIHESGFGYGAQQYNDFKLNLNLWEVRWISIIKGKQQSSSSSRISTLTRRWMFRNVPYVSRNQMTNTMASYIDIQTQEEERVGDLASLNFFNSYK